MRDGIERKRINKKRLKKQVVIKKIRIKLNKKNKGKNIFTF
jgi:hypothetical protein